MKKGFIGGALGLTLAAGGAAWAGAKVVAPVVVDLPSRSARGSLGSARNSADATQYIGCQVGAEAGAAPPAGYCSARNAASTQVECVTSDANLNVCSAITVATYSSYDPK